MCGVVVSETKYFTSLSSCLHWFCQEILRNYYLCSSVDKLCISSSFLQDILPMVNFLQSEYRFG